MFLEKNISIFNEDNDRSIHVSGHPCKDEIFDMYNIHILGDHGQRRYDSIDGLDNNELLL